MGTIALNPPSPFTLTVSVPQPNFYPTATARLHVKDSRGREVFEMPATSTSRDTVVFTINKTAQDFRQIADCGDCSWQDGLTYRVVLLQGLYSLDPPFKVVDEGAVTISGTLPCSDCAGEDPPEPPEPPPEQDNPFGNPDPGDPLISDPDQPDAPCLPPSFVMPAPSVPTPCSDSGSGSGSVFS